MFSCEPDKANEGNLFQVVLDDSVIFPTGGGQPNDLGTITLLDAPSTKVNVTDARRIAGLAVHFIDGALPVGSRVLVEIDLTRRTDHMQQHTAQHLLSAIAFREFQWDTASWSLNPSGKPCAVEFAAKGVPAPTWGSLGRLEELANQAVFEAKAVLFEDSVSDANLFRSREGGPPDTSSVAEADPEKGEPRFVRIEGHDINPCCGTHVPNLGLLQLIKIVGMESSARGAVKPAKGKPAPAAASNEVKTVHTRVYFVAGKRALEHYNQLAKNTRELAALSQGAESDVVSSFKRTLDSQKAAIKEISRMRAEAVALYTSEIRSLQTVDDGTANLPVVLFAPIHEPTPFSAQSASETVTALVSSLRSNVTPPKEANSLVILTTFPEQGAVKDLPIVACGTPDSHVDAFASFLSEKAGAKLKGGAVPGKDGWRRWQGKWVGEVKRSEVEGWIEAWAGERAVKIEKVGMAKS